MITILSHSAPPSSTKASAVVATSGDAPGPSSFYVEEPTIPPGETCAEYRRRHPAPPRLAPLAHLRAWLRYRQFGEALR